MRAHNILNLKIVKVYVLVRNFLYLIAIGFARGFGLLFVFCPGANHLPRTKNECCSLRVSDSHDGGSEPLWFIFDILAVTSDVRQIQ